MLNRELRRCWKYVPVECSLGDVKAGEFYQLAKYDDSDPHDPSQLFLATTDAIAEPDGRHMIMGVRYIEDPSFVTDPKFKGHDANQT